MRAALAGLALAAAACAHPQPDGAAAAAPGPAGTTGTAAAALQGLVLPPAEAGAFRSAVAGCAAHPRADQPATRAPPAPEKVEASALPTGLVLTHELPHACCLAAATAVAVEGRQVTVTETLSGTPCRCLCSSTLRTAVGLGQGTWAVEVRTVEPAGPRVAWTGEVTVR